MLASLMGMCPRLRLRVASTSSEGKGRDRCSPEAGAEGKGEGEGRPNDGRDPKVVPRPWNERGEKERDKSLSASTSTMPSPSPSPVLFDEPKYIMPLFKTEVCQRQRHPQWGSRVPDKGCKAMRTQR